MISPDPDLSGPLAFDVGCFRLKPLEVEDAADLLVHLADPEVTAFMDIDPLTDIEQARAIIAWAHGRRALCSGVRWAIRIDGGGFVGTCGFNALVVERGRRGEIAYDLSRPWWRRGVMGEIIPFLADFAVERLTLRRIEALVTPGNVASRRALERHGFAEEGLLRDHGYWKGRFQDQLIYGRLLDGAASA